MAAPESQIVEPQEFIPICDYQFSGDNRTVENKRTFVEWYRRKASIFHAAAAAQVARSTVYKWMDTDPQFAEAVQDSFEDAADVMESSTYEEALGTPEKPGNPLLKMFWLKAHRPKYRDRVSVDVEVVRNEIEERMNQLSLKQLPALTTQFLEGAESLHNEALGYQPINSLLVSLPSEQLQKEVDSDALHNPASE